MPHPDGAGLPRSTDPRLSADIKRITRLKAELAPSISRWRKTQDRNRLPCSTKHTPPWPRVRRYGTESLQKALLNSVPHPCGTERQQDRSKASVPRHSGVQTPTAQSKGSVPYQSSHGHPLLQIRNRGRRLPRATPSPGTDGIREWRMRLALIPVGHARHVVAAFEQTGLIDANLLELDP